jgi:uncharacterized protein (DUF1778 family)
MLQETMPSKRPTINVRLDQDTKDALIKAAKADDRSAQYLIERIVLDWLHAHGFLGKPERNKGK